LNIEGFGTINPFDDAMLTPKLIDLLPCLKSGIVLRSGITILFHIYLNHNNLRNIEDKQFFCFDDHTIDVFINTPAEFYVDKMHMTEAIEKGIVDHHLSSIEIIKLLNQKF